MDALQTKNIKESKMNNVLVVFLMEMFTEEYTGYLSNLRHKIGQWRKSQVERGKVLFPTYQTIFLAFRAFVNTPEAINPYYSNRYGYDETTISFLFLRLVEHMEWLWEREFTRRSQAFSGGGEEEEEAYLQWEKFTKLKNRLQRFEPYFPRTNMSGVPIESVPSPFTQFARLFN